MDRIDAMRVFVRVAQSKSFGKTADEMGLPRATISTAVQQLEAHLNTRLLHRTTRSVTLTSDGEVVLKRVIDLLDEFELLSQATQESVGTVRGRLRVDVPTRMARLLLLPNLHQLLAQHPYLELELRSSDRAVDLAAEGVDVAIRVGVISNSSLIARPLGQLKLINCASPVYLKKMGIPKHPSNLMQHRVVQYASPTTGKITPWEYVIKNKKENIFPPSGVTVNNVETYVEAAVQGFGLIQVPEYDVQSELKNGLLQMVLPNACAADMPLYALYPHRRHMSPQAKAFITWMEALIRTIPQGVVLNQAKA